MIADRRKMLIQQQSQWKTRSEMFIDLARVHFSNLFHINSFTELQMFVSFLY